eukprot:CAMPEP_0171247724 /NCGR_PEP_ID=MMETSP0790-20130122/48644_1 /TAXON_ID=2925 /ORGANISM="Alexandrium catenella, Strain OF101" /LENGTH=87 /DNA_ID=CAMNT_0011715145 /DNA_START=70 /DNA_END=330 /DNA_ORIENTATION=+
MAVRVGFIAAWLLAAVAQVAAVHRRADSVAMLQHSLALEGDDKLRITIKDEKGKELHLEARKTTRLGKLMDVVCKRLDIEKEYARFE